MKEVFEKEVSSKHGLERRPENVSATLMSRAAAVANVAWGGFSESPQYPVWA